MKHVFNGVTSILIISENDLWQWDLRSTSKKKHPGMCRITHLISQSYTYEACRFEQENRQNEKLFQNIRIINGQLRRKVCDSINRSACDSHDVSRPLEDESYTAWELVQYFVVPFRDVFFFSFFLFFFEHFIMYFKRVRAGKTADGLRWFMKI